MRSSNAWAAAGVKATARDSFSPGARLPLAGLTAKGPAVSCSVTTGLPLAGAAAAAAAAGPPPLTGLAGCAWQDSRSQVAWLSHAEETIDLDQSCITHRDDAADGPPGILEEEWSEEQTGSLLMNVNPHE